MQEETLAVNKPDGNVPFRWQKGEHVKSLRYSHIYCARYFSRIGIIYQSADPNNPTPTPHPPKKKAVRVAVAIEYFYIVAVCSSPLACNFEL